MSDQSEMVTPDPTPEGAGDEAVATADSPWAFSPEREERFQEIVRRYPTNFSAIMPTLWLCQEEWRWLRPGIPEWVAGRLDVPVSRVYEIITFYTMYYTEDPGKYNLQVCRTASCHLMGARKIVNHIKDRLGIEVGQTSEDGMFRLEEVECLGACGMAPMMQVGKVYHENLTEEKVDALIDQWRRDG
jgi:NADH-quinone oxidoreductase subunit E